ncbi:hypothetical protein O181_111205 [Austropuccinia psidii MF-1]|uniref:SNF2 N-terminal domain-containing protein n=1 Tax=Austropuccinia psidii MF-1 TaxID=1389203 RepID=A0A9Q3PSA6_9BASI|nr:hypothetical protein [Austropuccinia psidii MF-1]
MSTLYSNISRFKLDASFISCCFIIDFQAKTDTITQWIRPPHSIIQTPLLPHQKTGLAFLWDQEIPNGQSACNLWATSPPGFTFNARHIITNKAVSSFESLLTNTPLGGLLADDMGLEISKPAQAGALHDKLYHGPTRHSLSKADILRYDIIITSYNTITQEFKQTNPSTSFIFQINWHCKILDEHSECLSLNDSNYHLYPITLPPSHSYIRYQYTATHRSINSLLSSRQICLMGTPIHKTIYDLLGIISFITQPQSSNQDNWSPFILSSLSKGCNDILHLALRHLSLRRTKTTHLKSLPTISHHYELLPLNPTMQQEYSTLYKELLSSKSKGPGGFFRNINKL